MQIREIHVDGFGIFTDKHITGLTSGVYYLGFPVVQLIRIHIQQFMVGLMEEEWFVS